MRKIVSRVAKKRMREIEHILKNPIELTEAKLEAILKRNEASVYGKKHDFVSIRTPEEYAERVPLVEANEMQPWLDKVYENPAGGILTTDPVIWYLLSSGTTGKPKKLPVTEWGLDDTKAGSTYGWMAYMTAREGNDRIIDGTMVTFGAPAQLDVCNGIPVGYASGFYMSRQSKMFQRLVEPGLDVFNMTDNERKMEIYAKLIATSKTTVIQGIATLGLALVRRLCNEWGPWLLEELRGTKHESRVRNALNDDGTLELGALCPDLQMFGSSGIDINPYRKWLTDQVPGMDIWNFYGFSEVGIVGTQTELEPGIKMYPNLNYYEFIPVDQIDLPKPEVVPLSDVKKGNRYEIVATGANGWYRYRPGDLVTFIDTDPYTITEIARKGRVTNMAGEKLSEAHIMKAMEHVGHTLGVQVMDYTVVGMIEGGLPLYTVSLMTTSRVQPDEFIETFEEHIKRNNGEFEVVREAGALGRTRLVKMTSSFAEEVVKKTHIQAKPVPLTTDTSVLAGTSAFDTW